MGDSQRPIYVVFKITINFKYSAIQYILPIVLLLTTFTFANPLPAPVSPAPNPFTAITRITHDHAELTWQKYLELNIGPNGPHLDDFVHDKTGRRFEGGSRYSYWAAPQSSHRLQKRDGVKINIMYFLCSR
ncbi:hypothetical protein BDD12DRAFT_803492 [Trichophaea hybrida]|nr:hypothetical protein BDD12DRAFT_803492 [Trichophaea hybrida]